MKTSLKLDSLNIALIDVIGLEGTSWPLENPDSAVSMILEASQCTVFSIIYITHHLNVPFIQEVFPIIIRLQHTAK